MMVRALAISTDRYISHVLSLVLLFLPLFIIIIIRHQHYYCIYVLLGLLKSICFINIYSDNFNFILIYYHHPCIQGNASKV